MIEPSRLAPIVQRLLHETNGPLAAFWIRVEGDRGDYKTRLSALLAGTPVFALIVRDALFENPNTILADVVAVAGANRDEFRDVSPGRYPKVGIVLLGRNDLNIPQSSSPVTLPDWFPTHPGQTVYATIKDLTWIADGPLNAEETRVEELSFLLFELEALLIRRLAEVHSKKHEVSNPLLQLVRRGSETFREVLAAATASHSNVHNPTSFRPSVRDRDSLIARLWYLASTTPMDALAGPSEALASALQLQSADPRGAYETLFAALSRPSSGEGSTMARQCRSLLLAVALACRLVTAAAHSDAYPAYPLDPFALSFP